MVPGFGGALFSAMPRVSPVQVCVLGCWGARHQRPWLPVCVCVSLIRLPDSWGASLSSPNWGRPALGKPGKSFHQRSPAPPGWQDLLTSRWPGVKVTARHTVVTCSVPRTAVLARSCWGPACRVSKIPSPGRSERQDGQVPTRAVTTPKTRQCLASCEGSSVCARGASQPLPNTGEGRISSGRLPLSVWLQVCSDARRRGSKRSAARGGTLVLDGVAPRAHAARSQSSQASCAWSPGRGGRPIANFKSGILQFPTRRNSPVGVTSNMAGRGACLWHAVACRAEEQRSSALRNTVPEPGANQHYASSSIIQVCAVLGTEHSETSWGLVSGFSLGFLGWKGGDGRSSTRPTGQSQVDNVRNERWLRQRR